MAVYLADVIKLSAEITNIIRSFRIVVPPVSHIIYNFIYYYINMNLAPEKL